MLDVCLLGTSGMLPLPGRWLTSLLLRYNGSSMLIDCGEGTQIAIKEKGWSFHPIDVICFTHSDRTEPVTLIGPKGLSRVVSALRVIAPELPYELRFIELSESREHISINGYEIDAFKVNHAVTCYGYAVNIPRIGKFDVEKAKALEIPQKAWNRLQHGSTVELDGRVYTPDMVMGAPRKGLKVTYCTDSRPVKSISENAQGSDLFICEGMYGEKGKESKAREYKHMTFVEAAHLAREAQVKEMWLTHFSPSLVRPADYVAGIQKIFPNVQAGTDGKTVELGFED